MKTIIILITSLIFLQNLEAQISIYCCDKTGVVGYAYSAINENFSRDKEAEMDCRNKGGKEPRLEMSNNGYGCYAIVKGTQSNGSWAVGGAAGGGKTLQQCISDAKSNARRYGAVENSIYVYQQGCLTPPASNTQTSTTQKAQFSAWKKLSSSKCDIGIEYCTMREERYQLNYQLWFYYKVRNTSNKNISFEFHLTRKGKKEFGHTHIISPGGVDEWMHKMATNNIDGVIATNVINTQTNKAVCDEAGNENQTNNETDKELIDEINSYLYQIDDYNPTKKAIMQRVKQAQDSKSVSQSAYISLLKSERENAKRLLESLGKTAKLKDDENAKHEEAQETAAAAQKAAEEKADAERKAAEEKTEQYSNYMSNGETALNNNEYDNAISNFTNAQQYASTEQEMLAAGNAVGRAQKAKTDAARTERIGKQQVRDKKENEVFGTTAAAITGLMATLTDRYPYKAAYFRLQIGLGLEQLPFITNVNSPITAKSESNNSLHPNFHFGFKLGFLNNKPVSIHLTPQVTYGLNALSEGESGAHLNYGGNATLLFSTNAISKIKGFIEGGYLKRVGDYTYDLDASAASSGSVSTTDRIETAEYNYSLLRYGGGIMLHLINRQKLRETYIKPGIFYEKLSFAGKNDKPVMVFNMQANIASFILLDVSYSKNYAVGGIQKNPSFIRFDNQNFWSIKIIRQGAF